MRALGLLLLSLVALPPCGGAETPPLLQALDRETVDLAARALPGVVRIQVREPRFEAPPAPPEGAAPGPAVAIARFSVSRYGFVWDGEGRIVAADIPDGATKVSVTLPDGRETDGKVLGNDALTRLAVIQVAAQGLQPLPPGDPAGIRPGAWAMALAGAGEAEPALYLLTVGAVAAKGDYGGTVLSLAGGAPPAASGGPVLNVRGEVIGVLLASARRWGGDAEGIALSIASARPVVAQLAAGRPLTRGFLGIAVADLTPKLREFVGLQEGTGVFVQGVTEKGPAAAAGLQAEDVVLAVNGAPVKSVDDLRLAIQALTPGRDSVLQVWRKKEKIEVKVVPGEMPQPVRRAQADLGPHYQVMPGPQIPQLTPLAPGHVFAMPPGAVRPLNQLMTAEFEGKDLLEAVALLLNASGYAFTIDPGVLADAALVAKPFGLKTTNTPFSQVLDQLCADFGLQWQAAGASITFRKK